MCPPERRSVGRAYVVNLTSDKEFQIFNRGVAQGQLNTPANNFLFACAGIA
jgi:hypothetical protein